MSTRQFYSYLSQVLTRYDLNRDEFQAFKGALLDYLQRFVDEISRHMPQIEERLRSLDPRVEALCGRANSGQRLVGLDGTRARRAAGLAPEDWASLPAWFIGSPGRTADADNVRGLATQAMKALLVNLRRIAAGANREQSRYSDLLRFAGWFDACDDDQLIDWVGNHNLYKVCNGAYGAGRTLRQSSPDVERLLTDLVTASGGTALTSRDSAGWLDFGLVTNADTRDNNKPIAGRRATSPARAMGRRMR